MILSFGVGLASNNYKHEILEVYYPFIVIYPYPHFIKHLLNKLKVNININSNSFNLYLSNKDLFILYLELIQLGKLKTAKKIRSFINTKKQLIFTFYFI